MTPDLEPERSYARLREAMNAGGGLPVAERISALKRLRASLVGRASAYVDALGADFRVRSRHETLLTEVSIVASAIDYTVARLSRWAKPTRIGLGWPYWPAQARLQPEPRGVAGIIAPSNYPLQLALMPVVCALSAGCRVLLKPSEATPRTAELLRDTVAEALDPTVAAVICGDAALAARLTHLPLDVLLFTGSNSVGRKVAAAAAEHLTPAIIELGGKSPVIIDRGADLAEAATTIMAGKLLNAGQTCVAPDYVLAPRESFDEVVDKLAAAAVRLYPDGERRDYSAILSDAAIGRLRTLEQGLTLRPLFEVAYPRYRPALALAPPPDSRIMRDEIFGPLLPVLSYETLDEAIAQVRALPPALVLYWMGKSGPRLDLVIARTRSGAVALNETVLHAGIPALPFGGFGASGFGRYHGKAGFDSFSHQRVIFRQARWSVTRMLRPPFGKTADAILKRLVG